MLYFFDISYFGEGMICDLAGPSNDNPGRGDAAWHGSSNDAGPREKLMQHLCH